LFVAALAISFTTGSKGAAGLEPCESGCCLVGDIEVPSEVHGYALRSVKRSLG